MKKVFNRMIYSLSDKTELPLNEICRGFSASVLDRREITVEGVISIYKYETDCVVLEVCGDYISVFGEGLLLKNFYQTTICITGKINRVEYGGEVCR